LYTHQMCNTEILKPKRVNIETTNKTAIAYTVSCTFTIEMLIV